MLANPIVELRLAISVFLFVLANPIVEIRLAISVFRCVSQSNSGNEACYFRFSFCADKYKSNSENGV